MTQPTAVEFEEVYTDVCNPATRDFQTCHLFEHYTAGDPGLTGTVSVHTTPTTIESQVDITWQGITDRFGPPAQWHQHWVSLSYSVPTSGVSQ